MPNANPVVADAGGLFGPIYLGASSYKFTLTTSAGVSVWSQDNVVNITATNIVNADISASAAIAWTKISKTGSSLADLTTRSAAALSSGTLPDARFPATLPAASGVNLTALNATNLASGTVPDARFPATLPAASGVNLTALNATNLASGTVAQARLGTITGAWSSALTVDSVIQAATDVLVVVVPDASTSISFLTDSANPPTVQRGYANGSNGTSICCPVKKNDYFKAALAGGSTATIYSIPIGT